MTQKKKPLLPDQEQQADPQMEDLSAEVQQEKKPEPQTGYIPDPKEKHLMHLEIEQEAGYDIRTGKKLSVPKIIQGTERELKSFMETAPKLGYKIKIIYKPKS
jgi:hypothetical protein